MSNDILVVGGTGNQGSAVVDQLLASNTDYNPLVLTRDSSSEHAQAVAAKGDAVELVEGDLGEPESFREYVRRADRVFVAINFWTLGFDTQVRFGKNLASVLAEEPVEHVVFSGVANQDLWTGIAHFDSAQIIAEAFREADVPLTVLKPVFFMENWEVLLGDIQDGTLAFPLHKPHQQTTYYDTARAAVVAFENPDDFIGTEHNIVSDVNTLEEITEAINEIGGFDADPYPVEIEDAYEEFGEEFGHMAEWWAENEGPRSFYGTPGETQEVFGFEPQSFEEYLRANGWEGEKEAPAHTAGWAKAFF